MRVPGLDADLQRKLDTELSRGRCKSCARAKVLKKYAGLQERRNSATQNNLDKRRGRR